ncbi:hypothetical protein ABZZ20_03030 [Streptomyces sp. NPDC006430]|uniref:hypothetical protein n=1 Tax=Streptomyces sp. NPDC006430 TaxID=3154299 RepID=UPI0033B27343
MNSNDAQVTRMYEITYLDASQETATHVADAGEVRDVLTWAGRHGVKVRIQPYARADVRAHEHPPHGQEPGSPTQGDEQS